MEYGVEYGGHFKKIVAYYSVIGTGGRDTRRKGGERCTGGGREGAGSEIFKVAGSGTKRGKLRNIVQYFAIEKMQGGQQLRGGNRDYCGFQ